MLSCFKISSLCGAIVLKQSRVSTSLQCFVRSSQFPQEPIKYSRAYSSVLVSHSKSISVRPSDIFLSKLRWLSQNNKAPNVEYNLVKKKEKALAKALKNKYELELETLEKMQTYHFKMLEDLCSESPENKIQSPRFNEIKTITFQTHQDQMERIQEAMDVKKILIIQGEKDGFSKIEKLKDIMNCEIKHHEKQVASIKRSLADLKSKLAAIETVYGQDADDKNLELMRNFVRKHEHQFIEQMQRHEELMQRYRRFTQVQNNE